MSTKTTHSQRGKKGPVSSKKMAPPPKKAAPSRRGTVRKRRGLRLGVIAVIIAGVAIVALAVHSGLLFPPGIFLDGEPFSYGRPSERRLRREIERRLQP